MKVILLRHPHSVDNDRKRFPGKDSNYSKQGEKEFQELLKLDFDVEEIHSSPYPRCRILAEALSRQLRRPLKLDMRLREIDVGLFTGKKFEEIEVEFPELTRRWMLEQEAFCYPQGESYRDVQKRVKSYLQEIDKDVLIISHSAVLMAISSSLGDERGFQPGEWRNYDMATLSRS